MLAPVSWSPTTADSYLLPGKLRLLDQTLLPNEVRYMETDDLEEIVVAIRRLVVRGAPAIGCAAALGLAAVCQHAQTATPAMFLEYATAAAERLAAARPTAVNLFWALDRCRAKLTTMTHAGTGMDGLKLGLLQEALAILKEDRGLCQRIGDHGLPLFAGTAGMGVLTHCNAGGLATSGYGTALAPIYRAQEAGLRPKVYADETRPLLQGSRLTAWELEQAGVDVTVICDNMAAQVMREGRINLVIVGADRIAANGDAANKIGTYGVAVLARHHGIPFYVAAPYSTIDPATPDGTGIPIELRDGEEIRHGFGRRTAPAGCQVYNPAFDVTPGELISGIITEQGIITKPYQESIAVLLERLPS